MYVCGCVLQLLYISGSGASFMPQEFKDRLWKPVYSNEVKAIGSGTQVGFVRVSLSLWGCGCGCLGVGVCTVCFFVSGESVWMCGQEKLSYRDVFSSV